MAELGGFFRFNLMILLRLPQVALFMLIFLMELVLVVDDWATCGSFQCSLAFSDLGSFLDDSFLPPLAFIMAVDVRGVIIFPVIGPLVGVFPMIAVLRSLVAPDLR